MAYQSKYMQNLAEQEGAVRQTPSGGYKSNYMNSGQHLRVDTGVYAPNRSVAATAQNAYTSPLTVQWDIEAAVAASANPISAFRGARTKASEVAIPSAAALSAQLEDAKAAEQSALNKVNDYMSTYSGFLDLRDPSELENLQKDYTAATEARKAIEAQARSHEGYYDYKYRELSGLEKGLTSVLGAGLAALPVVTETAKTALMLPGASVDMNSDGMREMDESMWLRNSATENLSGAGKFLADTGLSIAQNLAVLPTAAIHPAAPLAAMGIISGAQKMYEESAEGESAGKALGRGALSGVIEALTEKLPLDSVLDLVKTGGRSALKNILEQAGIEATEEAIAYTLNHLAGKMTGDNTVFDWAELLRSAAAGGLSGSFFGATGTAAGKVNNAAFMPGSGLEETAVNEQARSAAQGTATAANTAAPTVDSFAQNTAPGAAEGQNNAVSTGEADLHRMTMADLRIPIVRCGTM